MRYARERDARNNARERNAQVSVSRAHTHTDIHAHKLRLFVSLCLPLLCHSMYACLQDVCVCVYVCMYVYTCVCVRVCSVFLFS